MRAGISINVSAADRKRLQAVVRDRNASQKHAWRAEIVLLSADGVGTNEIMRRTGKSKTCVWRWQERFVREGFDGLLRDKTRPSRIRRLGEDVAERVVALTLQDPPVEATHWTGAMMAKAVGVSVSSMQRIWRSHGQTFRRGRDFAAWLGLTHFADSRAATSVWAEHRGQALAGVGARANDGRIESSSHALGQNYRASHDDRPGSDVEGSIRDHCCDRERGSRACRSALCETLLTSHRPACT